MEDAQPKVISKTVYTTALIIAKRAEVLAEDTNRAARSLTQVLGLDDEQAFDGIADWVSDYVWTDGIGFDQMLANAGVTVDCGPGPRDKLRELLAKCHTSPNGDTELDDETVEALYALVPE